MAARARVARSGSLSVFRPASVLSQRIGLVREEATALGPAAAATAVTPQGTSTPANRRMLTSQRTRVCRLDNGYGDWGRGARVARDERPESE